MNPSSPKPSSQASPALQQAGPYAPAAGPPCGTGPARPLDPDGRRQPASAGSVGRCQER